MALRFQFLLLALTISLFLVLAPFVHAQFGLSDVGNALTIGFSPATPSPGDTVKVSVQSSLLDISESDILWQANGKTIAQGKGLDSARVIAGALGVETKLTVTVTASDGSSASTEATINPTELDLLVDSDSYTPPFYRGLPLPSVGTNLRLQAVPRFKRGNVTIPASELIYTWRRNSEVLGSISGRGRSTAIIPIEHIFGTDIISVEAQSADDQLSHVSSISASADEPVLILYEDDPLYGVMYHRALSASAFIPGEEATFAAVPFFVLARNIYDAALHFDWRVNSAEITANPKNPSELTINAENSSGVAFVELIVTHATNFYLNAKNTWNITFSSPSGAGASDPFHNLTQ